VKHFTVLAGYITAKRN